MANQRLRDLLYSRCKGYCEKCGLPLFDDWALHHRKLRSQGGKDDITNVLALHHKCHNLGTDSVHLNPKSSYQYGYLLKSWQNPAECSVRLSNGSSVILTAEGTYLVEGQRDGE